MGTRIKFATWRQVNGVWYVKPPNWPKHCELSFTDMKSMIKWSRDAHVMLKDDNPRRKEERDVHARPGA